MLALGSSDADSETGPGPDGDPQAPDVALESFVEATNAEDREATVSVDVTQSYDVDGEAEQYEHTSVYELEKDSDRWLVVDLSSDVSDPVGPDGA